MKTFWDKRYGSDEYVYGTEANDFFAEEINKLKPGYLMEAGAGEGRNAVYAARLGWDVVAIDQSQAGMEKTIALAEKAGTELQFHLLDLEHLDLQENAYDAIGMIFLHLTPEARKIFHQKLYTFLKPGGTLIMEAFSKDQLKYGTGGPTSPDKLYTKAMLKEDFQDFSKLRIKQKVRHLKEGGHHDGKASVLQVVAVK
ncbi:MAG: class I SAM-dependent methyltransferase [Bacteroidota bacterium]